MAAWTLKGPVIHFQDPNGSKTKDGTVSPPMETSKISFLPMKRGGMRDRRVILLFLVHQNTDGLVRQRLVPAADASKLTS